MDWCASETNCWVDSPSSSFFVTPIKPEKIYNRNNRLIIPFILNGNFHTVYLEFIHRFSLNLLTLGSSLFSLKFLYLSHGNSISKCSKDWLRCSFYIGENQQIPPVFHSYGEQIDKSMNKFREAKGESSREKYWEKRRRVCFGPKQYGLDLHLNNAQYITRTNQNLNDAQYITRTMEKFSMILSCKLHGKLEENMNQLFFECGVSQQIWSKCYSGLNSPMATTNKPPADHFLQHLGALGMKCIIFVLECIWICCWNRSTGNNW